MSATFKQKLLAYPFYLLPHHAISWFMFKIARIQWKPFKNLAIRIYTKLNTVNMDDAVITDKYAYESLNAFFTRAIKPERRPLDADPANWVCPVDGTVSQAGKIDGDRIFQAKGHDFSLLELLGGDSAVAKPFENGEFTTLYLSPRDYHRIHMPTAADLASMTYVPGRLFSVAEWTVEEIPRIFARNERLACYFETAAGPLVMVMVGAILTQNTAWSNVERAIANLLARDRLDAQRILEARNDHLANWLRPSGYFNIKAARLKNFCRWYLEQGGYRTLARRETDELRRELLSVNGVGHETADDMLLYAFERPVFVIDAYTRRLFARLGLVAGDEPYDELRHAIERSLGPDVPLYNEYHALIVRHAKEHCRVKPRCGDCVLQNGCPAAQP